ncbi:MAG: hypothetical protein EHM28_07350 [Spirochaetaceae bacterium]|nr:MAG: hypothetical protein EHM28_07350 [Spirochaetaceae bacterium]
MKNTLSAFGIFLFIAAAIVMLFSGCEAPVEQPSAINWINVGSSGAPVFQNGWANYNPTMQGLAFGIDSQGFLHIVGSITDLNTVSTTTQAVFSLPEEYRPAISQYTAVTGYSSTLAYIDITVSILSTGNFIIASSAGPYIVYVGHLIVKLD